jgi:hypothetical protein
MNLFFSVDIISTGLLSGLAVILIIGLICFFVVVFRRNNAIKLLDEFVAKINAMDFSKADQADGQKFKVYQYEKNLFEKVKLKDFVIPMKPILNKNIIFSDVLDFRKIYMDQKYQNTELESYITKNYFTISEQKIYFKDIIYIKAYYEGTKNSVFLKVVGYDEKNTDIFQIVDYEFLFLLDFKLKNFRQAIDKK